MDNGKKSPPKLNPARKSKPDATWEWRKFILQTIAIILSLTAILVTVLINKKVEDRIGKLDQPNIVAKVKVALSPNYTDPMDQEYLAQVGMNRKNVGYAFFNQSLEEYLDPDRQGQKRYLFIQLMNEGPGNAGQVRIDQVTWIPKAGLNPPEGLSEVIGAQFGILQANQMLTLLVDAAPEISPSKPLVAANAQEICIEYSYTSYLDEGTWITGQPLCISTAGPGQIEPMLPTDR